MAKEKIHSKFEGAPVWVITFADLATLMLTFFVLMLSFANQDIIKFREMLGSVQDAFGVTVAREGEFQAVLMGEGAEQKEKEDETQKLKRQIMEVSSSVKKVADEARMSDSVEIQATADGVRVRVKGEAVFKSGSVKIDPGAVKLLNGLADVMKRTKFMVIVEGHTDNVPVRGDGALYKSNWEISGVRASVVARYLMSRKMDPSRIAAVGYAGIRPLEGNDTPQGRARNRRVEFLIKK